MAIFNEVRATLRCPECGKAHTAMVQFKFGELWQYEYELGDALRWGATNDIGNDQLVARVLGNYTCPCNGRLRSAELLVDHGVSVAVREIDEDYANELEWSGDYVVVE